MSSVASAGCDGPPSAVLVAAVDERRMMTWWSAGGCALLGHPPEEVVGQPVDTVFTTAINGAFAPEAGEWCQELVLRHRDGHLLSAAVHVLPVPGPDGSAHRLVVAVPQPHGAVAEQALDRCELPVAILDTTLRVVRASRGLAAVSGLAGQGGHRYDLHDLALHSDSGESVEDRVRRVAATGEAESFLAGFTRDPAVPRRTWSTTVTALRNPQGQVDHLQLIALDATEHVHARQRLAVLNEVSTRVGTTLDVENTAQEMADVLVDHLADFATVDLLDRVFDPGDALPHDPVVLRRAAHASVLPGVPESTTAPGDTDWYPSTSPPARCLATGRSTLHRGLDAAIEAWESSDAARAEVLRRFAIHSVLVVPLRARGTTLGVSVMVRHRRPEPFEEDDLLLAEEIAARAAMSVDNARRYRDAHTTAVALQQNLLPQPPAQQQAIRVACRYRPAVSQAGVGGDWFDVIPLPGTRVALVVGDVVGHGLHASVTMGRLRTAVRTLADVDLPPDELLAHLDDLVTRREAATEASADLDGGIVATCLYAVYDPISSCLTLASAGHPLPLSTAPGAAAQQIGPTPGPPLGVGGLPFEMTRHQLVEGTRIALFTDGLVDRRHDQGDGTRQLRTILSRQPASLDAACDDVMGLLPEQPDDDVVLLLAQTRTLPDDDVATFDVRADPAAVADARVWTRRRLQHWSIQHTTFITELAVTELVTNAIRYAAAPIRLRLIRTATALTCEVCDASSTAPHLRRAHSFDEGGRGLLLVAQLTSRWGTRYTPTGKIVWAEVAIV